MNTTSDVKKRLLDAKQLVNKEDLDAALEICNGVLEKDRDNYYERVLKAFLLQKLDQSDEALSAFTKATELQPEKLFAWQGFAAFLEEKRSQPVVTTDSGQKMKEYSEKLSAIYTTLEALLSRDTVKQNIILKKHCKLLGEIRDTDRCVKIASSLLPNDDKETVRMVSKVLSPFLTQLDTSILEQVSNSLSQLLSSNRQEDLFYKEMYLQTMLQLKRYGQLTPVAQNILLSDGTNFKASGAVCVAYVEVSSLTIETAQVETAIKTVLAVNPDDRYALFAKGKWLLTKGRALEAKQLLEVQLNKEDNLKLTKALLCDAYKQLYQWRKVEALSRNALKDEETDWWISRLVESLLEQGIDSQLKEDEVAGLLEGIQETSSVKIFRALLYLRTGQLDTSQRTDKLAKCSTIIKSLEDKSTTSFLLLKAEYLMQNNQCEESILLLDRMCIDHPRNVDILLHSAKIMWNKSKERRKCVDYFLSVMKINRDIVEPYITLGNFYGDQRQDTFSPQRAMRCLEKAFQLDPHNTGTSQKLFDLYLLSQDTGSVFQLLDAVIQANPRDCRWAWIKKGHLLLRTYRMEKRSMEQGDLINEAASCLQHALDEAEDSSTWESLGDAYMARGSYTAALKAFQRAAELDDGSVYSAYQIASIKQILGEYAEAVLDFQALLEKKPDYVPALKGLAETLLCQPEDNQRDSQVTESFVDRVVDSCSHAFELLVRATQIQPGLACLWSLLGIACLLLRSVPESCFQRLRVPASLLSPENINKREVMELGPKFFSTALKILPDSASLWQNLAMSFQSCWMIDKAEETKTSALDAIKKAIALDPRNSTHWDALGQIAEKPSISQHAFIRALELNPNSPGAAATWTHLGSLYMKHGNLQLAHECFKRAQNVDPFHVAAWIGQAHIAEQLEPSKAMDLFRHTVSIGNGCPGKCEGSPSYAQWVLSTLADSFVKETADFRYSIVQMQAVPAAVDGLVRYVALNPDDSSALNLLGLLYEHQGLISNAEETFLRGIECLKLDSSESAASKRDKMKANLAWIYTKLGRCKEAIKLYGSLKETELGSVLGLALAHFKGDHKKHHASAYVTYEAALPFLASDEDKEMRSHLLVAMAIAAFHRDFPKPGAARNLLLESSQLEPPSVHGLLALGALGLLTEDDTLTSAALDELDAYQPPHSTDSRYVADITRLTAYKAYLHSSADNRLLKARIEIIRNIHILPNKPELWALLAPYQASLVQQSTSIRSDGPLVSRCALAALDTLRLKDFSVAGSKQPSTDVAQISQIVSLRYLLAEKSASSLTAAVKAVHCCPQSVASWSVLLATALPSWSSSGSDSEHRVGWLNKLVEHLKLGCDL